MPITQHLQASDAAVLLRLQLAGAPVGASDVQRCMQDLAAPVSDDRASAAAFRANGLANFERAIQHLMAAGVTLTHRGSTCPHCSAELTEHCHPRSCWLITQDRTLHEAVLRRKHCRACGALVGPGYYYFKHRTNRRAPRGEEDAARQQQESRHFFMLRESALILAHRSQKLFIAARLVEELQMQQVVARQATQRLALMVVLALRKGSSSLGCYATGATSQVLGVPGLDDRGAWLRFALDVQMLKQQCLEQQQQQQPGSDLLFVLQVPLRGSSWQQASAAHAEDSGQEQDQQEEQDDEDSGSDDEPQQQQQQQQQQQASAAQQCAANEAALLAASRVPAGTLHALLGQLVATPYKERAGNLGTPHPCMLEERPGTCSRKDIPVLLVDVTTNIQIRACGVPDCSGDPADGLAVWCTEHAAESNGCCVVVCDLSQPSPVWSPCPLQLASPNSSTCEQHLHLCQAHGAAAQHEAHGAHARPSMRWDKIATQSPSEQQQQQQQQGTPHTPLPEASRARRNSMTEDVAPRPFGEPWTPGATPHHQQQMQLGGQPDPQPADMEGAAPGLAAAGTSQQQQQQQLEEVYIKGRPKRDILVVSCGKCGLVLGSSVLWRGQPETSPRGLEEVLLAVRACLARHDLADRQVVLVYNDADKMHQRLLQRVDGGRGVSHLLWCVDPFRYLPKQVGARNKAASSTAAAAAAGTRAEEPISAVSPFRHELRGLLWCNVPIPAGCRLQLLLNELQQLLPRHPDPSSPAWLAAAANNSAVEWLLREGAVRMGQGGAVSSKEMHKILGGVLDPPRQLRHNELVRGLPGVSHSRLFFVLEWQQQQPGPSATAACGCWRVALIEVLVDCEALEQLFSRLQPGNTLHLKTQVHAIVELWSQLSLANMQTQLRAAEVRQAALEAAAGDGSNDGFADLLWQAPGEGGQRQQEEQEEQEKAVPVGKRPLDQRLLGGQSRRTLCLVRGAPLPSQLMQGTACIN